MRSSRFIVGAVIAIALLGAVATMIAWRSGVSRKPYPAAAYDYDIAYAESEYGIWDARLVRTDLQTGDEEQVIGSLKAAVPEVRDHLNHTFAMFAEPKGAPFVVLQAVYKDTDIAGGPLYAFDTRTKELKKMQVSESYDGFYGGEAFSQDGRFIAWAPNAEDGNSKALFLIDLVLDRSQSVMTLEDNETFNAGGFAMSGIFNVRWTDAHTIAADVYDQAGKLTEGFDAKALYLRTATFDASEAM